MIEAGIIRSGGTGGGIGEAPNDGNYYARRNLGWSMFTPGGGGISADDVVPDNMVYVIPGATAQAGKVFNTWAAADAYVATQTPSSTNTWGIYITGTNSENITIRSYVRIIGERGVTRLTGTLDTDVTLGADFFEACVLGCLIADIEVSVAGRFIKCIGCDVTGGTPSAAGAIICAGFSIVSGGDYSACSTVIIQQSTVAAGTFPSNLILQFSQFGQSFAGTLNGGTFTESQIDVNGATLNAGTYSGVGGHVQSSFTIPTGVTFTLLGTDVNGQVTIDVGGTLNTTGGAISGGVIENGTWNNDGVAYNNSTSGLTATNTQDAIDELAALAIPDIVMPQNTVQVEPSATPVAGKIFNTFAAARTYVLAQTPSITNTWGIIMPNGTFSEATIQDPYIVIIGSQNTRLTGATSSNFTFASVADALYSGYVNCTVGNVVGTAGNIHAFFRCNVVGGSPVAGSVYFAGFCNIDGVDWTGITTGVIFNSFFFAGTIDTGCSLSFCSVSTGLGGSITINGGTFLNSNIESATFGDLSGRTITLDTCKLSSTLVFPTFTNATVNLMGNTFNNNTTINFDSAPPNIMIGNDNLTIDVTGLSVTNSSQLFKNGKQSFFTYEITFAEIAAAATSNSLIISLTATPPGARVTNVFIETTTQFLGGSVTALTADVGITGSATEYITAYDLFAVPALSNFQDVNYGSVARS